MALARGGRMLLSRIALDCSPSFSHRVGSAVVPPTASWSGSLVAKRTPPSMRTEQFIFKDLEMIPLEVFIEGRSNGTYHGICTEDKFRVCNGSWPPEEGEEESLLMENKAQALYGVWLKERQLEARGW